MGSLPLLLLCDVSLGGLERGGGGGGNLREEDKGAVSARTLPAYMRRRRLDAWDGGR